MVKFAASREARLLQLRVLCLGLLQDGDVGVGVVPDAITQFSPLRWPAPSIVERSRRSRGPQHKQSSAFARVLESPVATAEHATIPCSGGGIEGAN